MFRKACRRVLSLSSALIQPRATYQNFVMSDALAQIERDCERFCPVPRFPPQKVSWYLILVISSSLEINKFLSTLTRDLRSPGVQYL